MPNSIKNFSLYIGPDSGLPDQPVRLEQPTVAGLLAGAQRPASGSAVVFLEGVPDAAVITPSTLEAVRSLDLPPDAGVLPSGVWDFMRQHQLSVREDQPAIDVMRLIEHSPDGVDWVTVLNGSGEPVGLVAPSGLTDRIMQADVVWKTELAKELAPLAEHEDVVRLIGELDRRGQDFHSETVNWMRPTLYECAWGPNRRHSVSRNPCSEHPGSLVRTIDF